MLKRLVLILITIAASAALIGSLTLWVVLSRWIPTKGKALVIETVERHVPVVVSIGAMRYELFRGFALEDVHAVDPLSGDTWLAAPSMRIRVGWLPLLLQKHVVFHARAPITAPCTTTLALSGRYRLRQPALKLEIKSAEIPLSSLTAPLTRYVPSSLQDGTVQLQLRVRRAPDLPLEISGRVTGAQLVWVGPSWRLTGDAAVEGTTQPLRTARGRWLIEADARLSRALLEGFPIVGPISEIHGAIRISPEQLDIQQLAGTALGSPWTLEGTVAMGARPSFEALITSRAALGPLAAAFPTLASSWQPAGAADVRAVCRGPLTPQPVVDCLAHAEFREVTLTGSRLAQPITRIAGTVVHDLLARQLSIIRLEGSVLDEALSLNGDLTLSSPPILSLVLTGTLPLTVLAPWLPPDSAFTQLEGTAVLELHIEGRGDAPRYLGRVELHDARADIAPLAKRLEGVTGQILLTEQEIATRGMTLRVGDQPLTLTGSVVPGAVPSVTATVQFPEGWCRLVSRISPEELVIDEGELKVRHSQVRLRGRISRTREHSSAVRIEGFVELGELHALPFAPLPALEPWRLQGQTAIEATFQGRLSHWTDADIQGGIRAEAVRIRDVPLEQVVGSFEQADRVLRLRIPSAVAAGGRFSGELTLDTRSRATGYALNVDLVGLQLERLRDTMPAWRGRDVSGQASTRLAATGIWPQRSSWRGEGWLSASGEQLGNVPLLDKLFRGLFGALANRLGLETLRRGQVRQAAVSWRLANERLFTDDLRFGGLAAGEPVALYAKGSVGLDGTLDFVIEPEFSEGMILQAPTTSTLASTILKAADRLERLRRLVGRHRLTGTLKNPDYRFELSTQEIFKQLAPVPGDLLENLFDAVR